MDRGEGVWVQLMSFFWKFMLCKCAVLHCNQWLVQTINFKCSDAVSGM